MKSFWREQKKVLAKFLRSRTNIYKGFYLKIHEIRWCWFLFLKKKKEK